MLLDASVLVFVAGLAVSCAAVVGAAMIRAGFNFSRWVALHSGGDGAAGLSAGRRLFGVFALAIRRGSFSPRNRFRPGRLGNLLVRSGALRRAH